MNYRICSCGRLDPEHRKLVVDRYFQAFIPSLRLQCSAGEATPRTSTTELKTAAAGFKNCPKCQYFPFTAHCDYFIMVKIIIGQCACSVRSIFLPVCLEVRSTGANSVHGFDGPTLFRTSADSPYEGPLVDMSGLALGL